MKKEITPDYIFETSWEVCNQVGGIYTVLSSRAKTLQDEHKDKIIFIGPDFWLDKENPLFTEVPSLLKSWKNHADKYYRLKIRVGRWNIPGRPIAILVDFKPLFQKKIKNKIYGKVWNLYGVDSISAYGDYDEASIFGIAAGMAIESYYKFHKLKDNNAKVIAHFNEWMTSFGLFYVKNYLPEVATVFTTHATTIGRSIAGNEKPLYEYLSAYNGDQMARELNVEAKHSAEKKAAHLADCFTTVSDITAKECECLLEKAPDIITPNGFEDDFIPKSKKFDKKRQEARNSFIEVAETLLGYQLDPDVMLIGTSGRYEYKNKGIDVFLDSLHQLSEQTALTREVVGFVIVPAHIKGPRADLQRKLIEKTDENLANRFITHDLHDFQHDLVVSTYSWFRFTNNKQDKVKIIFIPSYLNGYDGIFNKTYYDLLIGLDITVFPSYYEPWGYTPLESIAFSVPTVTTNLSGFGQWVLKTSRQWESGVMVAPRTDYNYHEVTERIYRTLFEFASKMEHEVEGIREAAKETSLLALWENFIVFYKETYTLALAKKNKR